MGEDHVWLLNSHTDRSAPSRDDGSTKVEIEAPAPSPSPPIYSSPSPRPQSHEQSEQNYIVLIGRGDWILGKGPMTLPTPFLYKGMSTINKPSYGDLL